MFDLPYAILYLTQNSIAIAQSYSSGGARPHTSRVLQAAQRLAHQPPRAHCRNRQNANNLARAAVGCMGLLDRTVLSEAQRSESISQDRSMITFYHAVF